VKVDGSKVRIALAGVIIGVFLGVYIGFSASPSTTQFIGGGIYPGAPSYTIWKEGSNYFAKNSNGEVEFSGTNATQVMLDAAGNGGRTLLLKEGTYELSTRVMIPSGTVIMGEGANTVISVTGKGSWSSGCAFANKNMMNYNPPLDSWITIKNLKITSTLSSFAPLYFRGVHHLALSNIVISQFNGTNIAGISVIYCNDTKIEKCVILNGLSDSCEAIYVSHSNYTEIRGNYICNMGREGMYIASYSAHTTIKSNVIINTTQGINIKPSTWHTIIEGNQIVNSTTGIYLVDEASGTLYYSSISGNSIANSESAIIVKLCQGVTVVGNTIKNCTSSGIVLESSTDCTVTANTVTDMNYGVFIKYGGNNTVSSNTLYNSKVNGYGICLSSNNTIVIGNFVHDTCYGIKELSGYDYNMIIGCSVHDCTTVNILTVGANTKVNLCWNGTSWIS